MLKDIKVKGAEGVALTNGASGGSVRFEEPRFARSQDVKARVSPYAR